MASPTNIPPHAETTGAVKTAAGSAFRLSLILALIVIVLTSIDRVLARTESVEIQSSARNSYLAGSRLLEAGKANEAVEAFRTAHALERDNSEYELALVSALTAAGRTAEAGPLTDDALQRQPNDGETNLIAARLAAKKGNIAQAESYYHRAIYGVWPDSVASRRLAARMELVDLMAKNDQKQELLAELISLQAEAPDDIAMQRRLAKLFLTSGSPARAAGVYQALTEKNPQDLEDWAGLGEAELENGRYREARFAFFRAFLHNTSDPSVRARLELLNTVMDLDPTPRQLATAEKYRRSLEILTMARASLDQCAPKTPGTQSGDLAQLSAEAESALRKTGERATNELAEEALGIAERLWRERVRACGPASPDEEALRLIMEKLAG